MTASLQHQCPEFSHYLREFRSRLKHAIDENKWYLSEQEGRDVGEKIATQDFLQRHFDRFAEEIRTRFCEHQCSRQKACPLSLFIHALPPNAKTMEVHKSRKPHATPR